MNRDTSIAPATLEEPDEDSRAAAFLEKQLLETAPDMDAQLRRSLASLGASIAKTQPKPEPEPERQTATEPAPPPSKTEQKGQLILFPQWADDRRAAVHAIFRSALFPALNNKQPRRYYPEQKRICSVEGVEVLFMGTQFDQSDLDVYLELLNIAHETPFGVECCFSAYRGHVTERKKVYDFSISTL